MKSETGPYADKEGRKRPTTPHRQVTGLISKGTYIQDLSWAAAKWADIHTCPPESSNCA